MNVDRKHYIDNMAKKLVETAVLEGVKEILPGIAASFTLSSNQEIRNIGKRLEELLDEIRREKR